MSQDITFSFAAPVYNEQEGLERFYGRLKAVADQLGEPYEILFINDGSTDDTATVIRRLAAADPHVRAVEFSRNFGHQAAITGCYDFARGKAVISLDSDCQHPPELIPDLVARWREGFEVVYTVRKDTRGISPLRRWIGRMSYRAIRMATGADLTGRADFRLLDRKVVEVLRHQREQARFLRGLVHWVGFRQVGMTYIADQRTTGRTGCDFRQLANVVLAGVFNFSVLPLRLAVAAGGLLLAGALLYALTALVLWPFGLAPGGWVSATVAIVALFGLQFVLFGILGEYVGRVFDEAKGRPLYVLRDKIGFDASPQPAELAQQPAAAAADPQEKDEFVVWT